MKKNSGKRCGNNIVAKYAFKINKPIVFNDKKKALKRGEQKHKKINVERYSIAA